MSQQDALYFRHEAEGLVQGLPHLLAEAHHLVASLMLGEHGRRRAGMGESFWQYRHALPGDNLAAIDWRRSGQSDHLYIREREWEAAHTVAIWCDTSLSMAYQGYKVPVSKYERASLIAMALSLVLSQGGERISLPGTLAGQARTGARHLDRIARVLTSDFPSEQDYGQVPPFSTIRAAQSVFLSDFMGDEEVLFTSLKAAANSAGVGSLVHILDPTEESFPFDGRIVFESMGGAIDFETQRAKALREEYRERLAERIDKLESFARDTGWHYVKHHTDQPPQTLLRWLYYVIGEREW